MSAKKSIDETVTSIASEIKEATTAVLANAKEAVSKVAPAIWKSVKAKVIGDAVAILIFVIALVGVCLWRFNSNNTVVTVSIIFGAFIIGSAVRRIIASDFFTLLEILDLAKNKEC